jgi:RimJ/RimL family protein N-acetyltransferase
VELEVAVKDKRYPDVILRADNFFLRPWKVEDAAWYVEARDEEVFKWTREGRDLTVEEAEEAIRSGNRDPEALGFAIVDGVTGEKVGSICLAFRENRGSAEVMYWLAPWGRGRGIATNAVKILCQWAFRSLGLERVTLKTLAGNTRSQLVAKRVGFQEQSVEDESDPDCLWFELRSEMKPTPKDFTLQYDWCAGSMPPPHHCEYTVHVGPGLRGEIVFYPDYPGQDTPVWTESFEVNEGAFNALYALVAERVLNREWVKIEDGTVGGSLEWMSGTVDGQHFKVPSRVEGDEALESVYAAIKALVPDVVWTKLRAQREQYERDYEEV